MRQWWGSVLEEEEEVEEVPSWPSRECPLDCIQMQERRQVGSVWGDEKVL